MRRRIEQYTGPYERWVYGDDLGRPFSFPAIRDRGSRYFSALMDSARPLPDVQRLDFQSEPGAPVERIRLRYPPLWNRGKNLKVRPFCFFDPDAPAPAAGPFDGIGDAATNMLDLLSQAADESEAEAAPNRPKRARYRVNFPINEDSWTDVYDVDHGVAGFKAPTIPPKAIIAVIDDGLPFANRTYLNSAGKTRVSHCWLQSARSPGAGAVPFGRELSNGQIDDLIAAHGREEDALYRAAGAVDRDMPELGDYMRRGTTHGAHIMSLAAGQPLCGKAEDSQDDIEIIAVQLPNTIAWDTSGFGKEMYMLSALHYIFERAQRISKACGVDELPLVINFSYGWSGGRHDGGSEMDAAIQELLKKRQAVAPTELVIPSGNSFEDKMYGQFMEGDFKNNMLQVYWQVQPDDRTSSYVEMWLPPELDPADYTFKLFAPDGAVAGVLPVQGNPQFSRGDARDFLDVNVGGVIVAQMSVDQNRGTRWRAMVALAPTMPLDVAPGRWARSGRWTLQIERTAAAPKLGDSEFISVYVQRDDDPSELNAGGRQSYLRRVDPETKSKPALPEYKQPLGPVRGFGSLSGVANAPRVVRVGGYVQSTGHPAPYSAAGGLTNTITDVPEVWGQHVDVCAVSDRSPLRPGCLGQGVRSGSRSVLVGTSGAAPQAARLIVRALADDKTPFAGMTPQHFKFKKPDGTDDNIKNAHWTARLGSKKAPPL